MFIGDLMMYGFDSQDPIWGRSHRSLGGSAIMASPVVTEWLRFESVVSRASHGKIAVVSNKESLNRSDVVSNADVIGPVIHYLGLRPGVDTIQEHAELLFYQCRPRGKRPLERSLGAFRGLG